MEYIYQQLGLPGFSQAKNKFQAYVAEQSGYQKNQYRLDETTKGRVFHSWHDEIKRWAELPQVSRAVS